MALPSDRNNKNYVFSPGLLRDYSVMTTLYTQLRQSHLIRIECFVSGLFNVTNDCYDYVKEAL